jgi:hypothetical protein
MTDKHPFRVAVENRDLEALAAALSEDVVFHAPVRFTPFVGREQTVAALSLAAQAFAFQDTFRYVDELRGEKTVALVFQAKLGDSLLEGVDYLTLDDAGLVRELRISMRPLSAMQQYLDFARERVGRIASAARS